MPRIAPPMQRTCPRDRTVLQQQKMEKVTVDVCPACSGAFFDADELGRVVGDKDLGRYLRQVHGAASSPMVCPACGDLMDLDRIEGVDIDHCTSCHGVWLDAGEMDKLAARGDDALDENAAAKARAAEDRRYAAMPRGGSGRFAALGAAFRLVAWRLRGRR